MSTKWFRVICRSCKYFYHLTPHHTFILFCLFASVKRKKNHYFKVQVHKCKAQLKPAGQTSQGKNCECYPTHSFLFVNILRHRCKSREIFGGTSRPATREGKSGNCPPPKFLKTYVFVRYINKLHFFPLPKISVGCGPGHEGFCPNFPKRSRKNLQEMTSKKRFHVSLRRFFQIKAHQAPF